MRFCLVNPELAPFSGSGVGTYAAHMASALLASGHEVHLLTRPAPGLSETAANAVLPAVRLHLLPRLEHSVRERARTVHRTLRHLHAQFGFDCVEFADLFGEGALATRAKRTHGEFQDCLLAVRLHSPIFLLRQVNLQHPPTHRSENIEHLEHDAIEAADAVLAPSRAILDRVLAEGVAPRSTRIVRNPFVPQLLGEGRCSPSATGTKLVLSFGRLEHRKGFHLLIDAAASLLRAGNALHLRIIGPDIHPRRAAESNRATLIRRIPPDLSEHIEFRDRCSRRDIARQIAGAHVCCFPSLWENFSYAGVEAMASGATVVASDAGGFPEMIEHARSGYLFPTADAEHLARALHLALQSPIRLDAAIDRIVGLCDPCRIVDDLVDCVRTNRAAAPC